ncbi:unnamed protein product [Moneuplotes crassus]|uniref:C2H2-type domain-containing protein n=1 Tax=Euplotes crassus TaxID=5936 RepID=A0AAD1U0F3_EUPCR|nr:unnamed protein product [Moneuplotes crassus]
MLNQLDVFVIDQLVSNYCCHGLLDSLNQPVQIASTKRSFIDIRDKLNYLQANTNTTSQNKPHYVEELKESSATDHSCKIHYETYKQIKESCAKGETEVSKSQIYENLLKPFKHETKVMTTPVTGKETFVYICKYDGCDKEYTKVWNLLDHVRMHEGIKPFKCSVCSKSFTQKGNLKKHMKQHEFTTLSARRKFKCRVCNKKYTEMYNLKAHMKSHT